ncbi:NADH-ubiquinone oxidoreductase chain N [Micavibrio aeruginosavorus EPB]|uniref:NADH-quinone oxidoreductase subunit N n=2 Tax=Micavibrio aeruginosavorus TaxID=349221 RepID=M4VHY5_9BACT|nr:NADH-quinone oxidoreductase subunit NuoN [Micavibrio aeruginosavorus]AGH98095.1 NADH-ubiquinone oxidoreductase chain N [Micavibrio aeruginosavorus EPB]
MSNEVIAVEQAVEQVVEKAADVVAIAETHLVTSSMFGAAIPEMFLAVAGMMLLIFGVLRGNDGTRAVCWGTIGAFIVTALFLTGLDWDRALAFDGMFVSDRFAIFAKFLILAGLSGALAISVRYLYQERMARFEYPVLVLFAGLGMMLMVSANNMLSLYVALELQSLSLYVLAAFRRDHARAAEAGIKYFVLGALASGMLLFGISLIYGYTGSLSFDTIAATLGEANASEGGITAGAIVGMVFVLVGLAFKVSAVPFHMWTPDVYEGAPTPVTALFAIVPKIAAMALLTRLLFGPFGAMMPDWQQIIWILSAASMVVGAVAGLAQNNIKRLLAYSSIGNMGYVLLGLLAGTEEGVAAVLFYLAIYMVMTLGVFAIVLVMRRDDVAVETINDLAGLSRYKPALAYAMALLLFSMSGIPPLAGFFGKFLVFKAAVASGFYVLAVLGVVASVVAAFYYLRLIKVMFFDEAADPFDGDIGATKRLVLTVCVALVVGFVLMPDTLVETTRAAASALFGQAL